MSLLPGEDAVHDHANGHGGVVIELYENYFYLRG